MTGRRRQAADRDGQLTLGQRRIIARAPVVAKAVEAQIRALDAAGAGANTGAAPEGGSPQSKAGPPGTKTPYYVRRIDVGDRYEALADGGDENSAISGLAGDDGRVHLGMELDSIIRDVAPDLYEYFGAFVREDMNNALRQVRQARAKKRKAYVHVTVNKDSRTVEVHDVETDGMPVAVFRDVYTVLGRSGNLDGRESGQKGIGRFAYLGASDTKIVETYARETGERYGFIVRGGKVFEPIPDDMLSISEYGTRTSVCVDDGHDFDELPGYVREIAAASEAPVYLTTVGFNRNCTKAKVSGKGGRGCACKDAVRIKTPDFEFVGCARCRDLPNRPRHAAYLIGIPIKTHMEDILGDLFKTVTLNILDERKYEPTTSRDWLSESASKRMRERVLAAVERELAKIECDPTTILRGNMHEVVKALVENPSTDLREEKCENGAIRHVPLLSIMSESVRHAVDVLDSKYMVLGEVDRRYFDSGRIPLARKGDPSDYSWRGMTMHGSDNKIVPRTLLCISVLTNIDNKQVWYAPDYAIKWRRAAFECVEDNRGPVIFLDNGEGWEELERLGAKRIAPYVDTSPRDTKPGRVTVRYGTYTTRKDAAELGHDVVCVPRDPGVTKLSKICVEMRANDFNTPNLGICPWHADAAGSEAVTFDRMRAIVDGRTYRTSAGPMTGRQILDTPRERLAVCPHGDDWVLAVGDDNVLTEAAGRKDAVVVYRTDDVEGDRLWLAYGYENGGEMPRILESKALKRAALMSAGLPRAIAEDKWINGEPYVTVGHLRMLGSDVQRVMYMRLSYRYEHVRSGDYGDISKLEQAAVYLSETDPADGDLDLCRNILRDMNSGGHCETMVPTIWGGKSWRQSLMQIAVNRLSRDAMQCDLYSDRDTDAYDTRYLASAKGTGMLLGSILRHLFGVDTTVRADKTEDGRIVVDAVLGRGTGGDGAVHLSPTLARMLFGHAPMYSIECTGDGRIRICGGVGFVPDKKSSWRSQSDPECDKLSKYDSW